MFLGLTFAQLCILIVLVAACIALVYVALRRLNPAIPAWVQEVFWILVVTVVIILAIKFVVSLW